MLKYKKVLIVSIVVLLVLALSFLFVSNTDNVKNEPVSEKTVAVNKETGKTQPEKAVSEAEKPQNKEEEKEQPAKENKKEESENIEALPENAVSDEALKEEKTEVKEEKTKIVPEEEPVKDTKINEDAPAPASKDENSTGAEVKKEPPSEEKAKEDKDLNKTTDGEYTCTLSVRCDTILNNMSLLSEEKTDIVPENGVIYQEKTVVFYEGESVFNLLLREMKKNKIHLEFKNVPVYSSAYIEGIGNLYEFDCGELSGWNYRVNGVFPNYGCSKYILKNNDRVEWLYTCDLGRDIGGRNL